jgi:methyl-accepting chemotaxis protein
MPIIKNLNVVTKLAAGFATVVLLLIGVGVFSIVQMKVEDAHVEALRTDWLPSVRASLQMQSALRNIRIGEYSLITARGDTELRSAQARIAQSIAAFDSAADRLGQHLSSPDERQSLDSVRQLASRYLAVNRQVLAAAAQGRQAEATDLIKGEGMRIRDELDRGVNQLVDLNSAGAEREGVSARQAYDEAIGSVIGAIVVAALVAAILAWQTARSISLQLGGDPRDAVLVAREIAAGNLDVRIGATLRRPDSLMHSLDIMRQRLSGMVRGIQTGSESIRVAASQIAQGNADLSRRTEEQAASLEETASGLAQLAQTVRHTATGARETESVAHAAVDTARRGDAAVERVVSTMADIS